MAINDFEYIYQESLYWHWSNLIPAWKINDMPIKRGIKLDIRISMQLSVRLNIFEKCWIIGRVNNAFNKKDIWWHLMYTLRWRQNGRDSISNHQPHDCLLNRLFRRRPKKTSKLRVTGLCARDRWIPRTNGQWRRKCFHLMTSSWLKLMYTAYSEIHQDP